jgi:hypothetical protein
MGEGIGGEGFCHYIRQSSVRPENHSLANSRLASALRPDVTVQWAQPTISIFSSFHNVQFKPPEYRGCAVGRYVRTSHFCAFCLGGLCQVLADSGWQSSVKSGSMWIAPDGIREIWSASFCGNIHVCIWSFFRPSIGAEPSGADLATPSPRGNDHSVVRRTTLGLPLTKLCSCGLLKKFVICLTLVHATN